MAANMNEAEAAKQEAIQRVGNHANEAWMEDAAWAIHIAAASRPSFTTAEVWPLIREQTHDHRAMGAAMRIAQREGYIEPTLEWKQSDSTVNHRRPQRVWRSLIWRGNADRT